MPVRSLLIWGVIGVALVVLLTTLSATSDEQRLPEIPYSELINRVDAGRVQSVTTRGNTLVVTERSTPAHIVFVPEGAMPDTVQRLLAADVRIQTARPRGPGLGDILLSLLPMLLLIGAWFFFLRQMQAKGKGGRNIVES